MDSKYGADKEQPEDMQDVGSGGSDTEATSEYEDAAEPATPPIETIADPPTTTGQFSSRDAEPPASKY